MKTGTRPKGGESEQSEDKPGTRPKGGESEQSEDKKNHSWMDTM